MLITKILNFKISVALLRESQWSCFVLLLLLFALWYGSLLTSSLVHLLLNRLQPLFLQILLLQKENQMAIWVSGGEKCGAVGSWCFERNIFYNSIHKLLFWNYLCPLLEIAMPWGVDWINDMIFLHEHDLVCSHIWTDVDNNRTGDLPFVFEDDFG